MAVKKKPGGRPGRDRDARGRFVSKAAPTRQRAVKRPDGKTKAKQSRGTRLADLARRVEAAKHGDRARRNTARRLTPAQKAARTREAKRIEAAAAAARRSDAARRGWITRRERAQGKANGSRQRRQAGSTPWLNSGESRRRMRAPGIATAPKRRQPSTATRFAGEPEPASTTRARTKATSGTTTRKATTRKATPFELTTRAGSGDALKVQIGIEYELPEGFEPTNALLYEAVLHKIRNGTDAAHFKTKIIRWQNPGRKHAEDRAWRQGNQADAWDSLGPALDFAISAELEAARL